MARIILKKNEERRIKLGHQWVFSNEIEKIDGEAKNGEVVDLFSAAGAFLGRGFYNKNSLIAYRHLTSKDEEIDRAFLFKRISLANSLRRKVADIGEVYRLVNSESDYLPGLIIDKFEDKFSLQIFSFGMNELLPLITDILVENFKADLIVEKNDNELRTLEGLEKKDGVLFEKDNSEDKSFIVTVDELKYRIDLIKGQKTGFYLDQRENRKLIRNFIKEEYKVLDLFCNEGGFALNAAYTAKSDIIAVDSSEYSIQIAIRNSKLNGIENIEFIQSDAFDYLNKLFQTKDRFDFIILDPPSFTKSKKSLHTALRGYEELNYKAMKLLKPNSFLFTFSCSHHISEKAFEEMIVKSSMQARKIVQVIDFRNCSYDHPVLLQMSETKYLKGYLLRII